MFARVLQWCSVETGGNITGSAEALHCCKAHAKIIRKMEKPIPHVKWENK